MTAGKYFGRMTMQRIVLAGLAALLVCTSGAAKAQVSDDVVSMTLNVAHVGPPAGSEMPFKQAGR
jgi:hypothetical protein